MFCMNCGTKLADDAVFCFNCGTKVEQGQPLVEPVPATVEQSVYEAPVVEQPVIEQPVYEEPVQPTYQEPMVEQAPSYHQPVFQQPVQPMYQQVAYSNNKPKGKSSKASVAAVVFGIFAVLASVMISLSAFMDGKIGVGVENIAFAVTSILIIVYAVSKNAVSSVIKGIGLVAVTVLHVIFFGVSAFRAAFGILGNAEAGVDYYYAVILLIELVLFYVYMLINIIKSFTNSKNASALMLLFGYISAILMIAAFVIDFVSDTKGLFAFKFIPVDLGIVLVIIADIFAVIGRAKKQETK